ncbi:hypothetical protein [Paenibacillus pinihumi]|uniref:hypothetical protein n=1 Tax=Paenibacillus pinihumi TaxID=669462 RepID=UPI0003F4BBB7|nr:hypothetical protein [Paenibacillus pinihumi]
MNRAAMIHGPYDDAGDGSGTGYVMEQGFIIDGIHFMYISLEGDLWLDRVQKVDGRKTLYLGMCEAVKLASGVTRGDIVIQEIYDRLSKMSGWQFLVREVLVSDTASVDFELLRW